MKKNRRFERGSSGHGKSGKTRFRLERFEDISSETAYKFI